MAVLSGAQADVRPIPEGYHSVTPGIAVKNAAALIDYLKSAFDAEEMSRNADANGRISHAEVKVGDSVIMLFDANENWPSAPGFFRLYVEDGDAVYQRALQAGGKALTGTTNAAFGDQGGRLTDPAGNIWWVQTSLVEVDSEDFDEQLQEKPSSDQAQEAPSPEHGKGPIVAGPDAGKVIPGRDTDEVPDRNQTNKAPAGDGKGKIVAGS